MNLATQNTDIHGHMKITWWSMSPNPWTPFSALPESCRFSLRAHRREMGTTWDDNEQQLVSFAFFFTCQDMWTRPNSSWNPCSPHMQQDQASTHSIHFNPIMKFRIGMNLVHFGSFWCWLWLFAASVANQLILGPTTSDREVCASWFQGTASRKQTDPLTCSCPVCFHFLDTFDSRKCRRFGQA